MGTPQQGERILTSGVCYLACYICGKPIGGDERLERFTSRPDSNGLGVIEACHEHCDRERLTELGEGNEETLQVADPKEQN